MHEIGIEKTQKQGKERRSDEHDDQGVSQVSALALLVAARLSDREIDRAAHAYPRPQRLNKDDHRPGDIDGGDPDVADIISHEKPVYDSVDSGKSKGEHCGKNAFAIGFEHL